ncbi:S41 family peptidase [Bernardetia sp. OM2101]|uniref:S41 family peptidase n=1 Tax=Bernardetia sp. OM2101 TaxID=3344876 RepID=UPI0035CFF215
MKKLILFFCLQFCFISVAFAQNNQETISFQALQDDAELLWNALNELHPALYKYNDTMALEEKYQKLLTDFSEDKTAEETLLLFSEFTAAIKCGHTGINPFNQENKIIDTLYNQKKLLPFTFKIIENQWVVYKSVSDKLKKGDVIVSINGNSSDIIFQNITKYIKTDGDRQIKKLKDVELTLTSKYEYFDYYFPLLYKLENEIKVEVKKNGKETTETMTIELLKKEERKDEFEKYFPLLTQNYDDLWSFKLNTKYAYLELGTFQTEKLSYDWKRYLNDAFYQINKQKIPHLIIDVRGNEGGNKEVTQFLMGKIANKDWKPVFKKSYVAYNEVNDSLQIHLTTSNKKNYKSSSWTKRWNENYRVLKGTPDEPKIILSKLTAYKGKIYLLIDGKVSADAFELVENCKKNNFATLIGTTTGGTKKGFTAERFFVLNLPNSNIQIDIPLVGKYPIYKLEDEGIEPNVEEKETLGDFIARKDKALDKAKKIIEQTEKGKKEVEETESEENEESEENQK